MTYQTFTNKSHKKIKEISFKIKLLGIPNNILLQCFLQEIISFYKDIDFNTDFPVVSIYINPNDLWSSSRGIYVKGPNAVWDSIGNYWRNANFFKNWEKEVFFEFFEDDKKRVIAQK